MEEKEVVKAGVSKAMKAPEPIVQPVKQKSHWFVEVVSGYSLSLAMVSSLVLFYMVLTEAVFV